MQNNNEMAHVRPQEDQDQRRQSIEIKKRSRLRSKPESTRTREDGEKHLFWNTKKMKLPKEKPRDRGRKQQESTTTTPCDEKEPKKLSKMPTPASPKPRVRGSSRKVTTEATCVRKQGKVTAGEVRKAAVKPRDGGVFQLEGLRPRDEGTTENTVQPTLGNYEQSVDVDMNASLNADDNGADQDDEMMQEEQSDTGNGDRAIEGEAVLEHHHSEAEWVAFEESFKSTQLMLAFSIDETSTFVETLGPVGIMELAPGIVQVCRSHGIQFGDKLIPTSQPAEELIATPVINNRALWKFLRKGYMKVHGVTVWVEPYYPEKGDTNLDILQIEYRNPNPVSAVDLHKLLQRCGAFEGIAVSHGRKQGRAIKWPAISCINKTTENPRTQVPEYAFRLMFAKVSTVNAVYKAWLAHDWETLRDIRHGSTITLKPIKSVQWDYQREMMVRPGAASERARMECRLHLYGIQPELKARVIETTLAGLGFDGARVTCPPGRRSGDVDLATPEDTTRLYEMFNFKQSKRLLIGNIRMFVNRVNPDGRHLCFGCDRPGHFQRTCTKVQSVDWNGGHQRRSDQEQYRARGFGRGPPRSSPGSHASPQHGHIIYNGRPSNEGGSSERSITLRDRREAERLDSHGQLVPGNSGRSLTLRERLDANRLESQAHLVPGSMVPMIKSLIATKVREQSQLVRRDIQIELARHPQDVNAKLDAHDTAIAEMRASQQETSSDIKALLLQIGQSMNIPNFGGGSLESGTGSRQ